MITIYGIKNCDTCRKAVKWLEAEGLDYRFHDFREDGIERNVVLDFISNLGLESVVNRRSTSWRNLNEADKAVVEQGGQAAVVALLVENPTLIKRPVFDTGEAMINGFSAAQVAVLSGL
jgi:arsenate reductase (glutaredoxin)